MKVRITDYLWFQEGPGVRNTQYTETGVKLLNVANLVDGKVDITNTSRYISEEEAYGKYRHFLVDEGDFIIASSGIKVEYFDKKMGFVSADQLPLCMNTSTIRFKVLDESKLNIRYFMYYLKSDEFKEQLARQITGSAQLNFGPSHLKKMSMPIVGLPEQDECVSKLDFVDSLITARREQLAKLDELVKSRFIELFGNTKNKMPVGEICNVTGGYSFKSSDISNDGAIKILQIGNVYLDNVSWETTNYLPEGFDEKYSKFVLNEGDIVVALTRPIIQSLGNVKACIVKSSDLPCLLNQRVGRIVAKKEKTVFLEFIYGCLMTEEFTRYVETCSIGCSQPNISTKDIENYLIPNATYEEQKEYVEFRKQTDKSKLAVQQSLEKLETLKKALMQKYFG